MANSRARVPFGFGGNMCLHSHTVPAGRGIALVLSLLLSQPLLTSDGPASRPNASGRADGAGIEHGPAKRESPLGNLRREAIPQNERYPWQPSELVAVIGTHTGRHWGNVNSVCYGADGKVIASAGEDGFVRLWQGSGLREPGTLNANGMVLSSVALSGDGKWLAGTGIHGGLRIWSLSIREGVVEENRSISLDVGGGEIRSVALSPDGSLVACGESNGIRVWALKDGKPEDHDLLTCGTAGVQKVLFSPSGKYLLAAATSGPIRLWDVTGRKPAPFVEMTVGERTIQDIAVSRSGGLERVWSSEQGWEISSLAAAPDGKSFAAALRDGPVFVFDIAGSGARSRIQEEEHWMTSVIAFAPDRGSLVCGGRDGTLAIWGLTKAVPEKLAEFGTPGDRIWSLAVSGDMIASCSHRWTRGDILTGAIHLWKVDGGTPRSMSVLDEISGAFSGLKFSPAGMLGVCTIGDLRIRSLDVRDGKAEESRSFLGAGGSVFSTQYVLSFSGDGRFLASAWWDSSVLLWDLCEAPDAPQILKGHSRIVECVTFSPDSQTLVSGGFDGEILLWRRRGTEFTKVAILKEHHLEVNGVSFSPDGKRFASAGSDGRVILWRVEGAVTLKQWQLSGPAVGVEFAGDGDHIAIVNGNGTVYILRMS